MEENGSKRYSYHQQNTKDGRERISYNEYIIEEVHISVKETLNLKFHDIKHPGNIGYN